jgi:hypothetical protein
MGSGQWLGNRTRLLQMHAKTVLTNSTVVAIRALELCAVGVDLQAEDRKILGYKTKPNNRINEQTFRYCGLPNAFPFSR